MAHVDANHESAPTKRQRPVFRVEPLEEQLFEWTDWSPLDRETDMIFYGITLRHGIVGLPGDDQIASVEWRASKSKVVFNFKDGSSRTFGLKISLCIY